MLAVKFLLALVLGHLLEKGLLLELLVVFAADLLVAVLAIESQQAGHVPALARVRVVDRLPRSFHFQANQLFKL